MDDEAIQAAVFNELLRKWAADSRILSPGELVTRQMMASKMPPRRVKDKDFDDEQLGGTAWRTAQNPAFD